VTVAVPLRLKPLVAPESVAVSWTFEPKAAGCASSTSALAASRTVVSTEGVPLLMLNGSQGPVAEL
jgi:hypothetical protein